MSPSASSRFSIAQGAFTLGCAEKDATISLTSDEAKFAPYVCDITGGAKSWPHVIVAPDLTVAQLALVKRFLTVRAAHDFRRPKRPLCKNGDLAANGVPPAWIAFVDSLENDDAFALLRAGDFLASNDMMDVACLHIARTHMQMTEDTRIGAFLNGIPLTAEEDAAAHRDNPWADVEPDMEEEAAKSRASWEAETSAGGAGGGAAGGAGGGAGDE